MRHTFLGQNKPDDRTSAGPRPAGLVRDTAVLTRRGRVPVQRLTSADHLITRHGGLASVRAIAAISVVARAIYVIAGSLGHFRREEDTLLSAGQPVLLRDWRARAFRGCAEITLPAGDLTDGEFVRDLGLAPMTLYLITCDRPAVLYAGGMELCTPDYADVEARSL